MAFCFKRKESVAKAVKRLGFERNEDALKCLKKCRDSEAVHCVRKDIKKVRAVLRLVRTEITKKSYRRQINLLREAADQLTATRDAYVTTAALRDLSRHFKGQLASGAWHHIRAAMQNALVTENRRFAKDKSARKVQRLLRRQARELDELDVARKGWRAICLGVKSSYGEGRQAYQTVLKNPTPENFHEWRKRAKDLWYQIRLLRPIWPEQMDAMANELKELTEYLGDDHDLVMLNEAVEKQGGGDGEFPEFESLNGLIKQRQSELQKAALALGARFYAEKPAAFCARLAGYWRTWRREKKGWRSADLADARVTGV